jgi:YggT family protein
VASIGSVLWFVLLVFLLLLIFRLVMEYVFMLARSYRPTGLVAVLLELCYTVTDPPLKALRRVIPPLRVGRVSIDLSFIVLFIVVQILMRVVGNLG